MSSGDFLSFEELDALEEEVTARDLLTTLANCAIRGMGISGIDFMTIAERISLTSSEAHEIARWSSIGAVQQLNAEMSGRITPTHMLAAQEYRFLQNYASQVLAEHAEFN